MARSCDVCSLQCAMKAGFPRWAGIGLCLWIIMRCSYLKGSLIENLPNFGRAPKMQQTPQRCDEGENTDMSLHRKRSSTLIVTIYGPRIAPDTQIRKWKRNSLTKWMLLESIEVDKINTDHNRTLDRSFHDWVEHANCGDDLKSASAVSRITHWVFEPNKFERRIQNLWILFVQ